MFAGCCPFNVGFGDAQKYLIVHDSMFNIGSGSGRNTHENSAKSARLILSSLGRRNDDDDDDDDDETTRARTTTTRRRDDDGGDDNYDSDETTLLVRGT